MAKEEAGVQPSNNHYWDPATEDRHVHDDGDDGDDDDNDGDTAKQQP